MTKKRTPHSSKRVTKKSKKKGSTQPSPKGVRFMNGDIALIEQAVKIWNKQFPDEHVSVNSFIRSTAVNNAKRTIQFEKKQGKLQLDSITVAQEK